MTIAKLPAVAPEIDLPYRLALNFRAVKMTPAQFLQLCADNGDLRMELTAERELIVMPPTGLITSSRNSDLNYQLRHWSRRDGTGVVFDSNGGYTLPNGAIRAPDASWLLRSRWESLTPAEQAGFAPICPDFVIELRSPSDSLAVVQAKMAEYMDNGARLGWLIDPQARRVYVYRPGQTVAMLDAPETVSGDPELPGFVLDLTEIW